MAVRPRLRELASTPLQERESGQRKNRKPQGTFVFVTGIDRPLTSLILLRGSKHQNAPSR